MTVRPDGRHVISITMFPELYKRLRNHCQKTDQPVTAYVRKILDETLPHLPVDS